MPARWLNDVFDFALVPDLALYLDVDVEHLLPRVLSVRQLDHWESQDDCKVTSPIGFCSS